MKRLTKQDLEHAMNSIDFIIQNTEAGKSRTCLERNYRRFNDEYRRRLGYFYEPKDL